MSGSEILTLILFRTIYFYYIAIVIFRRVVYISSYISQSYLFVVANNVGYLKRFAGL